MTLQLYDLGKIVAIVLGSMSGVLALFQLARNLFLDRLTQAMDSGQRDTLYRTLVWCVLTVLIAVLAVMNGYSFSVMLVVSSGAAAFPLLASVHFVYTRLQKTPAAPAIPEYPEIPADSAASADASASPSQA